MVDFAISAQFGLIYIVKKLIALTVIFSHSFDHRDFKLKHKLLYGHCIIDCAFDDDRTIVVAMVDFTKTANLVFYLVKNYLLMHLSPPTFLVVELSNFIKAS